MKNADDVKLIKAAILSNKKLTEMVPLGEEQLEEEEMKMIQQAIEMSNREEEERRQTESNKIHEQIEQSEAVKLADDH